MFRHEIAGPGGWGDPLERDPALVLRDVRNELVSVEAARNDYGVLVDTSRWAVDEEATRKLRSQLRARRKSRPLPKVVRADSFKPPKAA